ncbi:MAG TPA: transglutaminase-like domain-containing protein [Acidimicrobiia bacterium]|nr:transglutaminase-like domain-containing protein [Acidimicrobiia bacterium]HTC82585.1 transglutaminase-like domain-containing protein [Acidimicrobiia bacterium]
MSGSGSPGGEKAMARFADLVARPDEEIPLDEAAMLIAAQARPELDVGAELARLDELAAGCPEPTLDGLAGHLFGDLGFRGNTELYQDPDNSYLDQVLRRRVGIPISLSVLTMEVGRRLAVGLDGVGMPGHFLVRHRADPATFLDPFGGGRRLDVAGCRAIFTNLGGTGWDDAYLAPVGPRAILSRMLLNLQGLFLPANLKSAAWVLQLRLAIPGTPVAERLGLARALGTLGRFGAAAAELDRVADELPDAEAAAVRAEARALRARAN